MSDDAEFDKALADLSDAAWLNGGLAFKTRAMRMLVSMGERDLAAAIGRMDVPTRENWSDREEKHGAQDILDGVESAGPSTDIPAR